MGVCVCSYVCILMCASDLVYVCIRTCKRCVCVCVCPWVNVCVLTGASLLVYVCAKPRQMCVCVCVCVVGVCLCVNVRVRIYA